jgi:hypothetical protein
MKLILGILLLSGVMAQAQQREFYDAKTGRSVGRVVTGTDNSKTIYGPDGRVTGRTATDSKGTTTIYGPDGRSVGSTQGRK